MRKFKKTGPFFQIPLSFLVGKDRNRKELQVLKGKRGEMKFKKIVRQRLVKVLVTALLIGSVANTGFIVQAEELQIEYKLHTMVMDISADKVVTAINREEGMFQIRAKAVILAISI